MKERKGNASALAAVLGDEILSAARLSVIIIFSDLHAVFSLTETLRHSCCCYMSLNLQLLSRGSTSLLRNDCDSLTLLTKYA